MKPYRNLDKKILVILMLIPALWFSFTSTNRMETRIIKDKSIKIRGVYGSPRDLWQNGFRLHDLGINAVFIRYASLDTDMVKRARNEKQNVFVEFPVLNGELYLAEHPEAWPINEKGEKAQSAGWFMGICPTDPKFKAFRMDQMQKLVENYNIDGVWMDYFHWHAQFEDPHPILPETCFCDRCLASFSAYTGKNFKGPDLQTAAKMILEHYENEWRDWRCFILSGWARDLKMVIHEYDPNILLGLYHCPWNDQEFNGARRNILGLDYNMLGEFVDVFSPMVYHARMGRSPIWIRQNIEWFSNKINSVSNQKILIWPIIQTYDDPYRISEEEFELLFKYGTAGNASGIMVFTSASIAADAMKTELLKSIYLNWKNN